MDQQGWMTEGKWILFLEMDIDMDIKSQQGKKMFKILSDRMNYVAPKMVLIS